MKVAVIPARGGSKRIPRKNIREFCGRPIIAWSIGAALDSGIFDRVIVSTDDEEIADVGRSAGAEVPFMRPAALSDDYAGTLPVMRHAIEQLAGEGARPSAVCCIYATAPFVCAHDLRRGLDMLEQGAREFVFAAARYSYPVQRSICIDSHGRVTMLFPEHFRTRSQDLEAVFHDAGQFYWARPSTWISADTVFGPGSAAIVLHSSRVQDIDTQEDWQRAERMFEALRAEGNE